MNNEEADLQKYVEDFRQKFEKLPFEQVAFPRSVNGLETYWRMVGSSRRSPPNVRGSITYNNLLRQKNLTRHYHVIRNKDKIKWAWLKKHNPFQSTTLAVFDTLPKEFNAQNYIDYEAQYEKAFLSPIESITNVIGWTTKNISKSDKVL